MSPKRIKNEPAAPILVAARTHFGESPVWECLADNLYRGIQPTLKDDHLHLVIAGRGHYFIPARTLLDLARIWRDEPHAVRVTLNLDCAILEVKSSQDNTGKYWSRTEIKCEFQDPGTDLDYYLWTLSAVPFAFDDGSEYAENLKTQETQPADPWIQKAVSKDPVRRALCLSWGDFGADGYRAHIDRRLPRRDFADLDEYSRPSESDIEYYAVGLERELQKAQDAETVVTVDAKALAHAVKLAKGVNKESVYLAANGRLDVTGSDEWTGESGIALTQAEGYEKSGPDARICINPRYLLDALSGLSGEVLITLPAYAEVEDDEYPLAPISGAYLTDGTREALIMPKAHEG